jgi:hypothetical protein
VELKFEPEIIRTAPMAPLSGLILSIAGVGKTVKSFLLFTVSAATVTEIGPVDADEGTLVVNVN